LPSPTDMLPSQTALRQVRARWPLTGAHYRSRARLSAPNCRASGGSRRLSLRWLQRMPRSWLRPSRESKSSASPWHSSCCGQQRQRRQRRRPPRLLQRPTSCVSFRRHDARSRSRLFLTYAGPMLGDSGQRGRPFRMNRELGEKPDGGSASSTSSRSTRTTSHRRRPSTSRGGVAHAPRRLEAHGRRSRRGGRSRRAGLRNDGGRGHRG
jgi:hypothetical protein